MFLTFYFMVGGWGEQPFFFSFIDLYELFIHKWNLGLLLNRTFQNMKFRFKAFYGR